MRSLSFCGVGGSPLSSASWYLLVETRPPCLCSTAATTEASQVGQIEFQLFAYAVLKMPKYLVPCVYKVVSFNCQLDGS